MGDIFSSLNRVSSRLSEEAFLTNKGLSNEVGIHVFCYDPKDELTVREYFAGLKEKEDVPFRLIERDLYEIFLEICEEKRILKGIPNMEDRKGKEYLSEQLQKVATPEAFVEKMKYEPHEKGDVLVIYGVGKVYPFMRSHKILDNIQHIFSDIPVLMLYPGTFNGQDLGLFGKFWTVTTTELSTCCNKGETEMQLKYIYEHDIERDINGVIKVAQNDEESIKQELGEYIITRELRKHFNTFFNNYERSLSYPTDKIGVWISGFFGSGKSHFLKILSYLLSNDTVAGKKAVDYFSDKFDDPMMFAQLERCASVPTDTILFNIDSKSPINKDNTAILRVFAKVFYEYRGFYGDDLKVAKLEQYIEKSGKTEAFKAKFEEIHGDSWEKSRDAFSFFEDDVVEALTETLGMSETAARNWFNGTETADMSIEQLVKEIKEYIDSRARIFGFSSW